MARSFQVPEAQAGVRLDVFLSQRLELGRAAVKRLLERGGVKLNGRPTHSGDKGLFLYANANIDVEELDPADQRAAPRPDLPLLVLAQGPGFVIVDKPAGAAVHPLEPAEDNTVLNAVIARHPEIHGIGEGGLRSGVVHRLDLDTSGTLLFATTQPAWTRLREAFLQHTANKLYRAIVRGELRGELRGTARWTADLLVAQHRPARVRVMVAAPTDRPAGARRCDLAFRVLESFGRAATLVEVDLGTGFLHQIRAMFAAQGHPVLGDAMYGDGPDSIAPRQMLHACSLSAGPAKATSNDPADFARCLTMLRSRRA